MDLIASYIRSVRLFLPREQRDDITRELEEDLTSQVEEKQAGLGRPLSTSEQAALLRQYGHPMLMAARYRRARNLIGPVIFPIYWQVLKLVLGILAATNLASVGFLLVSGGSWSELGAAFGRFLDNGLEVAVFITLAAACAEWSLTRFKVLERWDPASMNRLEGPLRFAKQAARTDSLVRRALDEAGPPLQVRSVSEFVMLAVCACYGLLGLMFPSLVFASAASMLDWAPAVHRAFPLIVILVSLTLVDQYMRLMRPGSSVVRFTRVVWANVGWILIVLLLLADHQWVVWIGTQEQWARFGALAAFAGRTWSLVDVVNGVITTVFALAALASLMGPCWRLRRIFSRRRPHTAHA